jgi:hypothetical protein
VRLIILFFCFSLTSCATSKLINKANTTKEYKSPYIQKIVKAEVVKDKSISICLHGSETGYIPLVDHDNDEFEIPYYDFTITFYFNTKEGTDINWLYPEKISSNNFKSGCNSVINNNVPISSYKFNYNDQHNLDVFSKSFTNEYVILSKSNTGRSFHLLIPMSPERHKPMILDSGYYITKSKCTICYAGIPFTVAFDIITSPFQFIWILGLANSH